MKKKIDLEVPGLEELVNVAIEGALTAALSKNSDNVIKEVVRATLLSKTGSYGKRQPLIKKILKDEIRARAIEKIKEWMAANSEVIEKLVADAMKDQLQPEFVAKTIMTGLSGTICRVAPFKVYNDDVVEDEDYEEDDE